MQEATLNGAYATMVKHDTIINILKCQIRQHHVEELVEMIEMDTWITQFEVRTEKLRLREDHRHGLVKPVGLT